MVGDNALKEEKTLSNLALLRDPLLTIGAKYTLRVDIPGCKVLVKPYTLTDITKHGIYVFSRHGFKCETYLRRQIPALLGSGVIKRAG